MAKLNPKYHDTIVAELFRLLHAKELPFPYQVALTIEAIKRMSPREPKTLASELRKLGFSQQNDWYVRQKTIEAILVLPYRETSAETLANQALEDENPCVRRAGAALIVRGRVDWMHQRIERLVYSADPDVARVGLYLKRHVDDNQTAQGALAGLITKDRNDQTFLRRLPTLYLLRCHPDQAVGKRLLEYVEEFAKSKHTVVRWHADFLQTQLGKWVNAE